MKCAVAEAIFRKTICGCISDSEKPGEWTGLKSFGPPACARCLRDVAPDRTVLIEESATRN